MNRLVVLLIAAFALLACDLGIAIGPPPTLTPTRIALPTPPPAPSPTRAPTSAGNVPAWWVAELAMPPGAEFISATRNTIQWRTRDTNAEGLKDFFARQATNAGYRVTTIVKSQGAIYELLFVKAQTAFALVITLGSDATIIAGSRVGLFHLKVTGAANTELDLPMRHRVELTPGNEVFIGTSIPNSACPDCEHTIAIHIAPFKGAGMYDSKPGLYLIDLQVIPGGSLTKEDYRWAQTCVVNVKDAQEGTFDCRGLQNVYDPARRIDVSGWWKQPP